MGKRGPKPKVDKIVWTSHLAYAIGLLATDGCLSSSGRHIIFVSKDREQINNLMRALNVRVHVGNTTSGYSGKKTPRVQFGNITLYRFLLTIGLTQNKSKTLGRLVIPDKYFFHFLRGVFDGDGSTYSYWDKRWSSSFMFYVSFASASRDFLQWLQQTLNVRLNISGHITSAEGQSTKQLKYAKREGLLILKRMYRLAPTDVYLERKHLKIRKMLAIVGEQL